MKTEEFMKDKKLEFIEVWTSKRDFIRYEQKEIKKHNYSLTDRWIELHTKKGIETYSGCKFKIVITTKQEDNGSRQRIKL